LVQKPATTDNIPQVFAVCGDKRHENDIAPKSII
jgi:hypothetical protein